MITNMCGVNPEVKNGVMNWQPIETCPEITAVLFWLPNYEGRIAIGRMERSVTHLDGRKQDSFWGGHMFDDDNPPTHWMPLPNAPKA